MRQGAHAGPHGTTFVVRSPSADAVALCLFDGPQEHRLAMTRQDGGLWSAGVPGVGAGQRYGFRASGPAEAAGDRHGAWGHDVAKLLSDPYARRLDGLLRLDEAVLASTRGRDSAPFVPRSVVTADLPPAAPGPGTAWDRTVVYEMHVRGFTASCPGVPEQLRGTYAGLASPAAIEALVGLGVTAVELLPVQAFVSEPHLLRKGLANRWGYNTLAFLAPHGGYAATEDPVREFRDMVAALHAAGLEVLLDVVYNHSAEGDEAGPVLCLRGLDDAGSYRLLPAPQRTSTRRYDDVTGTGSTLDLRAPHVVALVADSLRYWVRVMGVDGFRFDLAPALARTADGFDPRAPLLQVIGQDPVLSRVKLIAEPWDVGPGGYRLGGFPHPWAEWNDRFRDTARDAWRGHGDLGALASAVAGSAGVLGGDPDRSRGAYASVNLVTAHDGFTLHDLTAYERKRNEANGEDGRDGTNDNRSWNGGVEGPTDDAGVEALRRRQARNLLATLLLSVGTPLLTMGDEVRRSQLGNNNAYTEQSGRDPLAWQPWDLAPDAEDLRAVTQHLLALRAGSPTLRRRAFATGEPRADGVRDLAWFTTSGQERTDWSHGDTLVAYLSGELLPEDEAGDPVLADSFLLVLHTGAAAVDLTPPGPPWAESWTVLLNTADERPGPEHPLAGPLELRPRSVALLRAVRTT